MFLLVSILVSLLTVLYVWYKTNQMRSVEHLFLDTDEDKLLSKWFDSHIKPEYHFDLDEKKVASDFLEKIYGIEVDPKFIIVGKDLITQHPTLSPKYKFGKDCIFYLRDVLGIDTEIAIIYDKVRRESMSYGKFDSQKINDIVAYGVGVKAKEFLENLLSTRWNIIDKLEDSNVINSKGSYLYIKSETKELFGNTVIGAVTPFGIRINLLCTDFEFDMLIKRWKTSLKKKISDWTETFS